MESTKILLCAVYAVECSTPKVIVTLSEVTAFAHVLGLQELNGNSLFIAVMPLVLSLQCYLCTAEGGALRLLQEGARAVLRLLGGARVRLHHKSVTEEREVRVSLALQSLHLKVPTLGWQRIRALLIHKG